MNNNKYLIATDFDGTLNRGGVSERDRDAIKRFRDAGNLFGVVTGRDAYMRETLIETNVDFDFVVVMNGAMILDRDGNTLFEADSDGACISGICEIFGDYGAHLSCVYRRDRITFKWKYPDGNDKYAPLSEIKKINRFTMLNSAVSGENEAAEATARINRDFGKYVNALQNGWCIDIPPRGIDKGEGVAKIAGIMGVPHGNIWCAGDNLNDLAMIERFHGCAVPNARDEVKVAAERTYDGIYEIADTILAL